MKEKKYCKKKQSTFKKLKKRNNSNNNNNNNNNNNKISKTTHSCNILRISFFKRCVREYVVAAVFILQLTLFQIFGPRNDILFCPLIVLQRGISNAIFDLVW